MFKNVRRYPKSYFGLLWKFFLRLRDHSEYNSLAHKWWLGTVRSTRGTDTANIQRLNTLETARDEQRPLNRCFYCWLFPPPVEPSPWISTLGYPRYHNYPDYGLGTPPYRTQNSRYISQPFGVEYTINPGDATSLFETETNFVALSHLC